MIDDEMKANLEDLKKKIEQEETTQQAERLLTEKALNSLNVAMSELRAAKPAERSELARRYAVTITELEKIIAYFQVYIVRER